MERLSMHINSREHPGGSKVSKALLLAFMRCTRRLALKEAYPSQWALIFDMCDATLVTSWASLKKEPWVNPKQYMFCDSSLVLQSICGIACSLKKLSMAGARGLGRVVGLHEVSGQLDLGRGAGGEGDRCQVLDIE
eukprot:8382000-Lingulodinium_polyedra.AAC.1